LLCLVTVLGFGGGGFSGVGRYGVTWDPQGPSPRHERPHRGEIARLALRQNGNVTGEQLRDLGLGREAIKSWARRKRLFAVHQGVFAVGRPPQTAVERYAAAVLACGPGAAQLFSKRAALYGI
jgi:hypothetical protein